eukprot:CAMPEP_0183578014 /NCGR_PEP_ID=MMETSP0371-20130417/140958_1 /TAXON_ID=268820 /ORGANISM="Peridinium aciculiferum, Strain PAER-2" /LENGTH=102 /DNA_ID=CAMNT_0025788399 /DNA_START=212 /DNA_END=520 /DNA_ORIENTATION=-
MARGASHHPAARTFDVLCQLISSLASTVLSDLFQRHAFEALAHKGLAAFRGLHREFDMDFSGREREVLLNALAQSFQARIQSDLPTSSHPLDRVKQRSARHT